MNRFYSFRTGSKIAGTRNRFLNILSLTHCIICVLYESCASLYSLFHLFIHSIVAFGTTARAAYDPAAGRLSTTVKISDICYNLWVIFRPAFVCLSVCLFVRKITEKPLRRFWWKFACRLPTLQKLIYKCDSHKNICDHYEIILWLFAYKQIFVTVTK